MESETKVATGLEVGDRYTHVAMVDEVGELVEESRIRTAPGAIRRRFESHPRARLAP